MVLGLNDTGQRRSMFIETQSTPNPSSLMFYPGKPVMEVGSADFPNARSAMSSPLAKALYGIDGTIAFTTMHFLVLSHSMFLKGFPIYSDHFVFLCYLVKSFSQPAIDAEIDSFIAWINIIFSP